MSESSGLTSLPATESTTETRVSSHDDTVSQVTSLDTVDEHAVAECAKLKGVVHEGMGLFDSATPEMKRKRNQKKDVSVLARLELNSIEVEATELVWSSPSLGNLKRMKPITGNPDSDEDTSSSPTKYSPRKRARTGSPGRRPLAAIKDEHDHDGFVQSGRSRTRMQFETSRNERIETHLNYGTGMRRQRFEIYHDEDEDEDENVYPRATTAATFSHPTPLHYLTAPLGQFSGPRLPQTPFQGPSQALFPGPLQALFQGPSQAQFQSHSQAQFQAHSPAQFQSHPQTQLPGPHLYNPFGTHISPLKTQMSPSRFGFQSTNTNAFYRDEKENLNFGPVQPAPFQPNFCSPGFTMSQYHIPPQQTNNYPPAVWSTPGPFHMSYFSQQPMEGLSPIKLSPLKLNREMSDDERTITAPPSDD